MLESISVVNFTKKYGNNCALDNISIEFKKNKVYAILGHNGAGKSTLIKEILGFNTKKHKNIHYNTSENDGQFPKLRMSFSPEKYELMEDLTVSEYLMFVAKLYKQHTNEVIERIEGLLALFELEEQRNKFIFTLSNGMKKKICHISALAVQTDFSFLDEPFAALDPVSIYHLKKYLTENLQDRGFIICTHQLAIIDKLEIEEERLEIILMNNGVIKFHGYKKDLFITTGFRSIEEAYVHYHKK